MVDVMSAVFGFIGTDFSAPQNLAEFMPYFFTSLMAFCLVAGFLQLIRWSVGMITAGGRRL